MNDIDRSVDSFDFAMRRRFRFIELRANDEENLEMLKALGAKEADAKRHMIPLNEKIAEEHGSNYQIGAAYFLKLNELNYDFDVLWSDYLCPLLQDYVQGMSGNLLIEFKEAYYSTSN